MPYIKESNRLNLDPAIEHLVFKIVEQIDHDYVKYSDSDSYSLTPEHLGQLLGDINYSVSRLISKIMGTPTYPKIAMVTGVLENIKQEYYRRVAEPYEDIKIRQNGDIKEYKGLI